MMKEKSSLFTVLLVCSAIVLIMYVLSVGPAMYLDQLLAEASPRAFLVIYTPLFWVTQQSQIAAGWLGWYLSFWIEVS